MKITMGRTVTIFAIPLLVSACGHKELTAPCSLRESPKFLHNTVLAFVAQDAELPLPFVNIGFNNDRCGPLKPINSFISKTNGVSDG